MNEHERRLRIALDNSSHPSWRGEFSRDDLRSLLRDLDDARAALDASCNAEELRQTREALARVTAERDAMREVLHACLPELDGEGTTIHRVWAALAAPGTGTGTGTAHDL